MSAHISQNPLNATRRNTQALEAERAREQQEEIKRFHAEQRARILARPTWRLPDPKGAR
jgi:hypothetical protein